MASVLEIKQHYGDEQARLLTELFNIPAKAAEVDISMDATVRDRLGPAEIRGIKAAEGAVYAESERDRLKSKYIELDLEVREAIAERVRQVELALSPRNASFADFAAAASATPEQLVAAMDMSLKAGDEDSALVAFQAGREREFEEVVSHAITINEEWEALYNELALAENDEEIDSGDRF